MAASDCGCQVFFNEAALHDFFLKTVLKNFVKFTGKCLCRSFILIKFQVLQFYQIEIPTQVFSNDFLKNLLDHLFAEQCIILISFFHLVIKN